MIPSLSIVQQRSRALSPGITLCGISKKNFEEALKKFDPNEELMIAEDGTSLIIQLEMIGDKIVGFVPKKRSLPYSRKCGLQFRRSWN